MRTKICDKEFHKMFFSHLVLKVVIDIIGKDEARIVKNESNNSMLIPRKIIALVDPKASWLLSWLHGHLGRTLFFELLETSKANNTAEQQAPKNKHNFIR